jgi:hypothetical protein
VRPEFASGRTLVNVRQTTDAQGERSMNASGGELVVTTATAREWQEVVEWAAAEGWNPGLGDAERFHPTDPDGFFLGRIDGEPVTAISVVNQSNEYAFLGYYLVHPRHRGTGLGLATWRAAVPHAGTRTIGLDAVPAQESTYQRSGFKTAYRTPHFAGTPTGTGAVPDAVVPVTAEHLPAIAAYDRECHPGERAAFLGRWLTGAERTAYVFLGEDGRVGGYGMIRPGRTGHRVGGLFADSAAIAEALFDALVAGLGPDAEVHLDIPEHRLPAVELATSRGLTERSHTLRMYTGAVPPVRDEATWAVTSLELG